MSDDAVPPEPLPGARLRRASLAFFREYSAFAGWRGVGGAALVAAASTLENVGVLMLIPFLAVATGEGSGGALADLAAPVFAAAGATTRFAKLSLLLGAFTILLALRASATALRVQTQLRLRVGFVDAKRKRLLRLLAGADWERAMKLRHARVTQILHGDILQTGVVATVVTDSAVALIALVNHGVAALIVAPGFALACFALIGAGAAPALVLLRRSYASGGAQSLGAQALAESLAQFLGGLKLAVSQNLQDSFVDQFEGALAALHRRQIDFALQQAASQQIVGALAGALGCLCALVGFGWFDLPAPVVIALLLILSRLATPVQTLLRNAQQFAHSLPGFERVVALEADLAPIAAPAPRTHEPAPEGAIVFSGATYLHDAGGGLRNLDLVIAPGEILGVAGPSGAGKTTFADLLASLIAPQSGLVAVGGVPLAGAARARWRDGVAYVAQDAFLFHDTLRRNLLWANPAASEAEVWRALEIAGAAALIRAEPKQLETIVGERGARFSGGERQRIALARAVLRRPRLLLLDEATNAIDIVGEADIFRRLSTLDPAPTLVVIAHRPDSLRFCTRILHFSDGRLVDGAAASKPPEA